MSYHIDQYVLRVKQLLCLEEAVKYGSISKAAEQNNIKQPNLSKHIKDLEESFAQKLVVRHSKGVCPTDVGFDYYALACEIKNILDKSEQGPDANKKMLGLIRLWTSDGLGLGFLSRCFNDFYQKYPKVNVQVTCSLEMPKLDEFDMAVLFHKPAIKALNIKQEYTLRFGLFASKEYLTNFGYPKDFQDLQKNHKICNRENYGAFWKSWEKLIKKATFITSVTNSSALLLSMIKGGIGIGLLPVGTASKEADLVELKNIKTNYSMKFWLVVRRDLENSEKIKALSDIMHDEALKL